MQHEKREEDESVYYVMVQTKLPQSKVQQLVKTTKINGYEPKVVVSAKRDFERGKIITI